MFAYILYIKLNVCFSICTNYFMLAITLTNVNIEPFCKVVSKYHS